MMLFVHRFACVLIAATLFACSQKKKTLFTQLTSEQSGIHFTNTITEDNDDSTLISEFSYMGGGVGIGDFNNDGLKDIFFCANQKSSELYINKGDNQFENITGKAGVGTKIWATGVSVVDINNDGYDDIYVCAFGKNLLQPTKNLLFINQKNLTFKEEGNAYGLADTSYSTQASFFDYDKDGDLDMYLLNYRLNGPNANTILPRDTTGRSLANDHLYRNDGDAKGLGHPVFTDVTLEAGIKEDGFGLGVAISDYNGDNWPDIYVSNDFISNDELWLNNQNGTFTNVIKDALQHQSYSSMGADAADINNDGLPDIATVDMMPEFNERKKVTSSFMNYERYETERTYGYEPEFMRNMLQLNNGTLSKNGKPQPFFSEIGQLAGISETDWSWSILMADFNNDGWKDIHITNGIGRDYINSDFIQYRDANDESMYNKSEFRRMLNKELKALKHVELSNYFYLNNKNYRFQNFSVDAGIDEESLSSGAAYADLDNDGDLDLVVNNINKEAFVFVNNTVQKDKPITNHSLRVTLDGNESNAYGFGAKVLVYQKDSMQLQEQIPVRGYLSSVDRTLLFGLGNNTAVDSIVVIWPNDKKQTIKNVKADALLTLHEKDATENFIQTAVPATTLFTALQNTGIAYKHADFPFNDYTQQRLLPQKYSQLGPFIDTADVNGDGLTDFYVGGAFNSEGGLFIQTSNGDFRQDTTFKKGVEEDGDCRFFDADGDGDKDLFIANGETRFGDTSAYLIPRLFLNDGRGNFRKDSLTMPGNTRTVAGCVSAGDYDGDGDLDLFIGGRVSAQYPMAPKSFLLQNNKGRFTDVTAKVNPELQQAGMITAAVWTDLDNDRQLDLVLAGEWMPIRFYKNNKGRLTEITETTGLAQNSGMWRSLAAADVDNDGDMDFIAGNLGQNCKYHITASEPMKLFAKDIDGNGSIDPVPFYFIKNKEGEKKLYPAINRDMLADQVPAVKKHFLKHAEFAKADPDDFYSSKKGLTEFSCEETSSCYFENMGNGKFSKHVLPNEAQFAPINAILCSDLDNDGIKDLLVAGNEYQTEVMTGRYDALYGLFLKGTKKGFFPIGATASGFFIKGDVKDLALITTSAKKRIVLAGVNADSLRAFQLR